ncbi:MAG: trypsin-like peptidase domain-containing protein [Oscillospiraceae bacterium]|nr:trypsin-like peptidase domain-containing protein [Oscillospiraceae bacterium]
MCGFDESTSYPEPEENSMAPEAPQAEPADTGAEAPEHPRSPYASSPFTGYYDTHGPRPAKEKKHPLKPLGKLWPKALALVLAAACLFGGIAIGSRGAGNRQRQLEALEAELRALEARLDKLDRSAPTAYTPLPAGEVLTPAQVYARNVASVVGITCDSTAVIGGQSIQTTVTGSGFLLSEDGYVVTNYHVVAEAATITVVTQDAETHEAALVGRDTTADMALLKVEGEHFQPVTLGSSTELAIGDMVVAIGNPLSALEATQTVGYISGKNREVSTDNNVVNMLQTDAAINSGNSGGPLFNMRGEVVGITTAKYSGTSASGASIEGLSFAIPIDDLKKSMEDLMTQGYIRSAYLGIRGMDVEAAAVDTYGLPKGTYVESVEPEGAAAAAGVQPKDIITALGDHPVDSFNALARALRAFQAGDRTQITVYRGGQTLVLDITLSERPQDQEDAGSGLLPESGDYQQWYDYFRRFFADTP